MNENGSNLLLLSVIRTLAMIDTEELQKLVEESRASLRYWDGIGVMIDPTAYRNALQSGNMEDEKNLLKISEALLEARKAIDVREALVRNLQQAPSDKESE